MTGQEELEHEIPFSKGTVIRNPWPAHMRAQAPASEDAPAELAKAS